MKKIKAVKIAPIKVAREEKEARIIEEEIKEPPMKLPLKRPLN